MASGKKAISVSRRERRGTNHGCARPLVKLIFIIYNICVWRVIYGWIFLFKHFRSAIIQRSTFCCVKRNITAQMIRWKFDSYTQNTLTLKNWATKSPPFYIYYTRFIIFKSINKCTAEQIRFIIVQFSCRSECVGKKEFRMMDVWWEIFNWMRMNGGDSIRRRSFFIASIVFLGSDKIRHIACLYGRYKCEKHIKIDLYGFV